MTTRDKTQGGAPAPPRAEPLQPDRPGRGSGRDEPQTGAGGTHAADESRRLAEQEKAALDNVRKGYGKR